MSDSRPDSETVIASGRLNARKSIAGSGRSMRNGSTISRVAARAVTLPDRSPRARQRAQVARHVLGRLVPLRRVLHQRTLDDPVGVDDRQRPDERRRLIVQHGVQRLDRATAR